MAALLGQHQPWGLTRQQVNVHDGSAGAAGAGADAGAVGRAAHRLAAAAGLLGPVAALCHRSHPGAAMEQI